MTKERRFRLEARAAAAATRLVSRLPRRLSLALGRGLGRLWAALDRRHVAIAAANLRQAFPQWEESRGWRTARDVYAHFGTALVDLLWLDGRRREDVLPLVEVEGREHVESALAAGRGALLVTAHIGNWELHGLAHGWLFGPIGVIARPLDNPALDERLCALRTQGGNQVISKRKALATVLRLLREGRGVAVLIDQNVQEKDGIFVEFFGRPAATTTVAAALALKTGCALVPTHTLLSPDGRYRLVYDEPLEWQPGGDRRADIAAITQRLTTAIEGWIRDTPQQWLWMHRRWKTRPPATSQGADAAADGEPARAAAIGAEAVASHASSRGHKQQMTISSIVIRAPNWLGDVVLSLSAVRDVRRNFPDARIAVLARPSVGPLYRAVGEVDEVLTSGGLRADAAALRGRFEAGILLPNSFGSALALRMARIPERWGWSTDGRRPLLTRAPRVPPDLRGRNQLYYYRAMLAAVGLDTSAPAEHALECPAEWDAQAGELLAGHRDWIGVSPGAHFGTAKRWPAERFAAVAQRLARETGAAVAILGTASERPLAARIASLIDVPTADLCGRTGLPELVGVLGRLRLLLTNDSGPMHVAAAMGTPVAAVFGPTDSRETAPLGTRQRLVREPVHCSPCLLRECPIDHRCMRRVTVERVRAEAASLLAEAAAFRA